MSRLAESLLLIIHRLHGLKGLIIKSQKTGRDIQTNKEVFFQKCGSAEGCSVRYRHLF